MLGGEVKGSPLREYGRTSCRLVGDDPLLEGLEREITVWMSHGDAVTSLSDDWIRLGETDTTSLCIVRHKTKPFWGIQFHPEVTHTPKGAVILANFLHEVCGCTGDWKMSDFHQQAVATIRAQVGPEDRVICGLSGGVDSAVTAKLVHDAVGERLVCIFVDNGLLRSGEFKEVVHTFRDHMQIPLVAVDASKRFLDDLAGVTDPEKKRKSIGRVFIDVFRQEAEQIEGSRFLAQGTLYPDVIESVPATGGPSATIKSHHNVGGLPEELGFELIEPLRFLFKDEVRRLGAEMGMSETILQRHPFPGPGLAIRIIGEVTPERLTVLQKADLIVREEISRSGYDRKVWQAFAVLLPVQSVGVMGDERTYEDVCAIRVVESVDGMTADWADLPQPLLDTMSRRITNEVKGINRVVYDISSKPPSTIEWE